MGRVTALALVGILAWLAIAFDRDDLLMADASNEKLIAILYTPHVEPGDYATIRLTLRTGTKSELRSVRASHNGTKLKTGPLERNGSEALVPVLIPENAGDGTLDILFDVSFEPPPRTPSHGYSAQIDVPIEVATDSLPGRVGSAVYALLGLLFGIALAATISGNFAKKPPMWHGDDVQEMAGIAMGFAIGVHLIIGLWMFAMHIAAALGTASTWLFIAALVVWFAGTGAAAWWAWRRMEQHHSIPPARAQPGTER